MKMSPLSGQVTIHLVIMAEFELGNVFGNVPKCPALVVLEKVSLAQRLRFAINTHFRTLKINLNYAVSAPTKTWFRLLFMQSH